MATVRLTESSNKEILQRAAALYDSRLAAANVVPPEFNMKDVYEAWLDSEASLRADVEVGIRRKWLEQTKQMYLRSLNGKDVGNVLLHEYKPGVWVPPSMTNYGNGMTLRGERASELYEIWKAWDDNRTLVVESRDTFKEQIKNLLARHQTLKQAMGEWPALWDFVPQAMRDKHNEEKEKAARAPKDVGKPAVDLDVLNGAVVTAKVMKNLGG
jgi:hypothetical protein